MTDPGTRSTLPSRTCPRRRRVRTANRSCTGTGSSTRTTRAAPARTPERLRTWKHHRCRRAAIFELAVTVLAVEVSPPTHDLSARAPRTRMREPHPQRRRIGERRAVRELHGLRVRRAHPRPTLTVRVIRPALHDAVGLTRARRTAGSDLDDVRER